MRLRDLTQDSESHFHRLKDLYTKMSETYRQTAAQYEFSCQDCPDNCCMTRFYNHTYIEYFFLMEGMAELTVEKQTEIKQKAIDVCHQMADMEARGEAPRVMCPVNVEGLCNMYEHRPMICRLHGIPYDLLIPGREPHRGEGCTVFNDKFQSKPYIPFDRTPLYQTLSGLERQVRAVTGKTRKIKMTIAEMIAYDPDDPMREPVI